jgi:hypothetical protein
MNQNAFIDVVTDGTHIPTQTLHCTKYLACAGNRRSHTRKIFSTVKGLGWDVGAIGNNVYKGVLIHDLLLASGFT